MLWLFQSFTIKTVILCVLKIPFLNGMDICRSNDRFDDHITIRLHGESVGSPVDMFLSGSIGCDTCDIPASDLSAVSRCRIQTDGATSEELPVKDPLAQRNVIDSKQNIPQFFHTLVDGQSGGSP